MNTPAPQECRAISVQLAKVKKGQSRPLRVYEFGCSAAPSATIYPIPKLTVRVQNWLSPRGRPLSFHLVRFAGCNYLCAEFYGAITLAFGQQVVPGNQLLLWPDRGTRVPANTEPRSEGMQLILSVSRQAKQRRRRGRPAQEEPTPISQLIHVHSHGILHSATLPMAKEPP